MVETDITGYGRKMGRDAGNYGEGKLASVVYLQGEGQPEGTVSFRTMVPSNSESGGGSGLAGDFTPTSGRDDGVTNNNPYRGGTSLKQRTVN
tara:strand:- start:286 stop:561 length:276 start_codon:yes stop_codon:yes gene_type:complete